MEFDMSDINGLITKMPVFVLVLFRMSGIFFTAPVFSHKAFPIRIKASFAFFLALIVFHSVDITNAELTDNMISFGLMSLKEVAVGAIIGFSIGLLFMMFSLAGTMVGRQIGLEMASTLSPGSATGGSLIGFVYYFSATMIFFATNAHHWVIKTLAYSYKVVPLAGFRFNASLTEKMINSLSLYFAHGVKMAAPFIIVGFLSLVVIGIVLKITQQTNLFILELPMKALVGFALLIVTAPFIIFTMRNMMDSLQVEVVNILRFLR